MFIDTNVLVASRFLEAPNHEIARPTLERAFRDPEPLRDQPSGAARVPGRRDSAPSLGGYEYA